ncbi:sulfide:quinone oxidoreductase, mitochondrial [Diorhabda carinulata]|uniref:sulfide:quinone oxidoreductase, mitochondrial n=1 Tax=Diorhabda carinulata TaxID=1163345 RepID=UPI00259FF5BD|nr:sulfide:quinone oxidoreductase, mitochondrial [Diorhabda carinulata]
MVVLRILYRNFRISERRFSATSVNRDKYSCKILVVGGGAGGCSTAAKFARTLKKNELIVLEPSEYHYYQPLFTIIGGGTSTIQEARRKESDVLPKNCTWIKDKAALYDPDKSFVTTEKGDVIEYDYMLIAVGLELRYDLIPGLQEALDKSSNVCSIYSPKYAPQVFEVLKNLKDGAAHFTFPNSPVKCPGAPQKICYISDHYLRKQNRRDNVNITYNTSLPVIFGVKKYADALWKLCKSRNIDVNLRTNLVNVNSVNNEATFQNLDNPDEKKTVKFSMLHVVPPMATPLSLSSNKKISNEAGFVNVHKHTLQHIVYPNIFSIGDCASTPNSKTAAAAAAQTEVVFRNLSAVMNGQSLPLSYDGYASCPLVTGYDKCILAEFDYNLNPLETFPFDQDKELRSMYILKKIFMPQLYWNLMLNGYWNGPALFRRIMHLQFMDKKPPAKS